MSSDQPASEGDEPQSIDLLVSDWKFGFVTACRIDGLGYCGGYLILNGFGHPCEFHCSLPIKPSRTQEILYGARLDEFLIGHSIIPALLSKTKIMPAAILTGNVNAITTQTSLQHPVAVVDLNHDEIESSAQAEDTELQIPSRLLEWTTHCVNENLRIIADVNFDVRKLELFAAQFCIREPFQRVQDALTEAQTAAAA